MRLNTSRVKGIGDFTCIGSDCEDSCCFLTTPIVPNDLKRAENSPWGEELARGIRPDGKALSFQECGKRCHFLTTENLCRLQKNHGHAALPTSCRTYPRLISRFGGDLVFSGHLSCPEMARKLLLRKDASQVEEGRPLHENALEFFQAYYAIPHPTDEARFHADCKTALLELLPSEAPLWPCILQMSQAAKTLDSPPSGWSRGQLLAFIGSGPELNTGNPVHQPYFSIMWFWSFTAKALKAAPGGRFSSLLERILATLPPMEPEMLPRWGEALECGQSEFHEHAKDRIGAWFRNLLRHQVLQHPVYPDRGFTRFLEGHFEILAACALVLGFHPTWRQRDGEEARTPEEIFVEVVQSLFRDICQSAKARSAVFAWPWEDSPHDKMDRLLATCGSLLGRS